MPTTFTPPLDALTTIFTPPCPTTWLLTTTKVPSQSPPFPTTGPASCDPPSWDTYLDSGGFQYYSPAICPSGFVVGPSCEVTNPRTSEGFPVIAGGETAAYCVPSGHTCTSDTTDFRGAVWGFLRTATASGAAVTVGPAIQIRWREADLANLETDPLTPGLRLAESTTSVQERPPPPSPTTVAAAPTPPSPSPTTTQIMQMTIIPSPDSPSVTTSPTSFTSSTLRTSATSQSSSNTEIETPSSSLSSSAALASSPSPSPSPSSSSSSTTGGAQTPGSATQDDSADGANPNPNPITSSGFNIAAIALTATLLSVIQGYAAFLFVRRYRRYRAGHVSTLFPSPSASPSSSFFAALCRRINRRRHHHHHHHHHHPGIPEMEDGARWWEREREREKNPDADAELGAEGPLPELETGGGASPLGSSENPAELGGVGIGVEGMAGTGGGGGGLGAGDEKERERERERWSWRARVSRIMFSRGSERKDA
ncbi:hypothetical protein F4809DRAFT_642693 [Biscogniauxia mediterranea]|nr:hypothetical protein F4809DRAFT_642693 [Biscogniauxia mediterranea]